MTPDIIDGKYRVIREVGSHGLRRVVRDELDLSHVRVSVENGFEQSRSDALTLLFGKNKDILNENDGMPIPDRSDDPKQFFVLVC